MIIVLNEYNYALLNEYNIDKKLGGLRQLQEYYKAKKYYYNTGKTLMTDLDFDHLESSIKAVWTIEFFEEWQCVGYDEEKHKKLNNLVESLQEDLESKVIN